MLFVNLSNLLLTISLFIQINYAQRQNDLNNDEPNVLTWCTVGVQEMKKCENFKQASIQDREKYFSDYLDLQCFKGVSKKDCMRKIDDETAQITNLDAGEVFTGGMYHSLVPILQEVYNDNRAEYYAVAVIKRGSLPDVTSLRHLRGKKSCFAAVGSLASWILPIEILMKRDYMKVVDCNNHVKNAINFFGPSCAVNSLLDKFNPIGDNSDKLCQLCTGVIPGGKCTESDPYFGYTGAFRCLVEAGEIAFLKHSTVPELVEKRMEFFNVTKDDFELLCLDGSRKPVDAYENCNWGPVPSHAIVTSSATAPKLRRAYQKFLQKSIGFYGSNSNFSIYDNNNYNPYRSRNDNLNLNNDNDQFNYNNPYNPYSTTTTTTTSEKSIEYSVFNLFESAPRYGNQHNLLFQDSTVSLRALDESKQNYKNYLGHYNIQTIMSVRKCPVNAMSLCVTSDAELIKCSKMKIALRAQLLKPELTCYRGHSHIHCMQAIRKGDSDVAVFDAGDIYTAGLIYDLIPFISEVYDLGLPSYYVVAVGKEDDPTTELTYLRGKNTCHSGINTGAGWIVPMAFLLSNGWMRGYGCHSVRAAAEYFTKSCVPGAISSEYNTEVPHDNMCHLCHGTSFNYCRRDASEEYYGHTGAFRCLVEGGGDVAFVKHTTVAENTGGKNKDIWARNTLIDDFELMCPDGTRAQMNQYEKCNLGKVQANAIVTRGGEGYNETELNSFINLFVYAQQFYGRKDEDNFNFAMFTSESHYSDLIFQDATTQLEIIPSHKREYSNYLGNDFMRAKRVVDCHAGVHSHSPSSTLLILTLSIFSSAIYFGNHL